MDLLDTLETQLLLMSFMSMDYRDDMSDEEVDALVQKAINSLPPLADE